MTNILDLYELFALVLGVLALITFGILAVMGARARKWKVINLVLISTGFPIGLGMFWASGTGENRTSALFVCLVCGFIWCVLASSFCVLGNLRRAGNKMD
jgi:hypothetical protein